MKLQPFTDIIGDMPANYSSLTTALIPDFTFVDSQYLGDFSRGAYYLLLLGTVAAALALFMFVLLFFPSRVTCLRIIDPSQWSI